MALTKPLNKQLAYLYGQVVHAAYQMYLKDPNNLTPDPIGIPEGYEVGAWIHMSDFVLNSSELKFYGIVVREIANPDSRIIAIRGTEGRIEWLDDMFAMPVRFRQVPSAGRVAYGFDKIYSTLKVVKRRLPSEAGASAEDLEQPSGGSFVEQLEQLAISREKERNVRPAADGTRPHRPTVIAGHSLGAALSTLFVLENHDKRKFDVGTSCTFASPRVGTLDFVNLFNKLPIVSWRIFNKHDIVPKLPPHIPVVLDYEHVDAQYEFDSSSFTQHNLVCWHVIETYLHWLDSTVPLRQGCTLPRSPDELPKRSSREVTLCQKNARAFLFKKARAI
jgi:hypothetical protein